MIPGAPNPLFHASQPVVKTWNPLDKASNILYTNGNLTATSTDGNIGSFRGTWSSGNGALTWSVTIDDDNAGDSGGIYIGVCDGVHLLTDRIGRPSTGAYGWAIVNNIAGSPAAYTSQGSSPAVTSPWTFTTGDVITCILDMSAGTLGFKKNGGATTVVFDKVYTFPYGSNPPGLGNPIYPACTIYTNGGQLTGAFP